MSKSFDSSLLVRDYGLTEEDGRIAKDLRMNPTADCQDRFNLSFYLAQLT